MCVRGKTPWGPQSLLSDPRERWFPFFLSSCFPFLFCLPHFVSVILVHYLCLTANLWVLSGITLMEDGGSYFMPKLDEPQEYVMEKQLHLLAKRGAFWHSICRFLPCGEIMPPSIPTLGMGWVTAGTAGWRHGLKAGVQTEQIKIQDAPSVSRDILRCKKKKKKKGWFIWNSHVPGCSELYLANPRWNSSWIARKKRDWKMKETREGGLRFSRFEGALFVSGTGYFQPQDLNQTLSLLCLSSPCYPILVILSSKNSLPPSHHY